LRESLATLCDQIEPRDFVAARDLSFAVVLPGCEDERVLTQLRYVQLDGGWRKLGTAEALGYLTTHLPQYRYYSNRCAAEVHGVPVADIDQVFKPRCHLACLIEYKPDDILQDRARRLCEILRLAGLPLAQTGISGSLLVGRHRPDSDIDLVVYDREAFNEARASIERLCENAVFRAIDQQEWHRIYVRRGCALDFDDFVWHERRKCNKALFEGTKFDLTLVTATAETPTEPVEKLHVTDIKARILDDRYAFDYPARYVIDSEYCSEILSYTQTYAGQARTGEWIQARGLLERTGPQDRRLIIGTSREAEDQFLRVIRK
jgi:uncharacterized protein